MSFFWIPLRGLLINFLFQHDAFWRVCDQFFCKGQNETIHNYPLLDCKDCHPAILAPLLVSLNSQVGLEFYRSATSASQVLDYRCSPTHIWLSLHTWAGLRLNHLLLLSLHCWHFEYIIAHLARIWLLKFELNPKLKK